MKKIIKISIAALVVLLGAYTGFWYFSANKIRNEASNVLTGNDKTITLEHEGMVLKGFPFNIEVVIKNPSWKQEASTPSVSKVSTVGSWTLGTTALGTSGWIEISGSTTIESHAVKEENLTLTGSLRFETDQPKKIYEKLISEKHQKPQNFEIWELMSGQTLSADNLSILLASDKQISFEVDHLKVQWKKAKELPPYSTARDLNIDVKGYIARLDWLPNLQRSLINVSGLPDANFSDKTDFSLEAQIQYAHLEEDGQIGIEVKKMITKNAWNSFSAQGKLVAETPREGELGYTLSFSAKYEFPDQHLHRIIENPQVLAQQYRDIGFFAIFPKAEVLFTKHGDQIADLITRFSTSQSLETQFDMASRIRIDGQTDGLTDWSCDLKKWTITAAPYEISMQGNIGFKESTQTNHFGIRISNYKQLIETAADFYSCWRSLLTSTEILSKTKMPPINNTVVNRAIVFLQLLSLPDNEKPNDLNIVVKWDKNDLKTVGALNSQQFVLACSELLGDIVPELYPAAE